RQIIRRWASPSSILSQLLVGMNQPQISCPQISQMNADGENHRDDPLLVRLADSAILEVAIRWSSAFSGLTDHPKGNTVELAITLLAKGTSGALSPRGRGLG